MSKKVIVSVKGGLVTAIYSNDENIEVEIFDFDNFDSWQEENELKEYEDSFKQKTEDLKVIY